MPWHPRAEVRAACAAGEDVGHYGGSYKVTYDLHKKYGDMRLLDTPICGEILHLLAAGPSLQSRCPDMRSGPAADQLGRAQILPTTAYPCKSAEEVAMGVTLHLPAHAPACTGCLLSDIISSPAALRGHLFRTHHRSASLQVSSGRLGQYHT